MIDREGHVARSDRFLTATGKDESSNHPSARRGPQRPPDEAPTARSLGPAPEADARQNERLLAAAFDRAPVAMSIVDAAGRWLRVNDAYCELLGYQRAELLDMDFRALIHPDDGADYQGLLQRARSGVTRRQAKRRYVARDGRVIVVNVRAEVILDESGEPIHTISQLEDITERELASRALARSQRRLSRAEELVGCGSWEFWEQTRAMTCSDGFLRIFGLETTSELSASTLEDMVHPADRQAVREAVSRCLREGRASVEHRIVRPDGVERTLSVEGELVAASDDVPSHLRGGVRDVTDEQSAFYAAPMGMAVVDPDGLRLVRVNGALCATFGQTREQLTGRCLAEATHGDDRAAVEEVSRALADGTIRSFAGERRYLRCDGSDFWADIYVTPEHGADGSVRAFLLQMIDITERKDRDLSIQTARVDSLRRLAIASEYRDDDTHEHTERVGRVAEHLARAVGADEAQADLIRQAAPLHDIGKIGISDLILLKPGPLTADERQVMQRHTLIGADIVGGSESPVLQMAAEVALTHHERWDGAGYPTGLRGEEIPLSGRIVAIADVFDALTHSRPYKAAWPVDRAVAHILGQSGRQFAPDLVTAFATLDHARLAAGLGCEVRQVADTAPRLAGEAPQRIAKSEHAAADRVLAVADRVLAAAASIAATNDRESVPDDPPPPLPPEDEPQTPTVTMREACAALGVSEATLRRWGASGRITEHRTPGGHRRYRAADIRRLNEGRSQARRLRTTPPPDGPAAGLASVLERDPAGFLNRVVDSLYERRNDGWFGRAAARVPWAEWVSDLSSAARTGGSDIGRQATIRFMRQAELGGTTLRERYTFLERAAALAVLSAQQAGSSRDEIQGIRRVFARLCQGLLDDADRS